MSNGRGTDRGQEPSTQNNINSNSNGHGRGLLVVGFPPFGRNTKAGVQNASGGRGRESNHGNPLSLRGRGQASDSMPSPSSPMSISGRGQASIQALVSSSPVVI